jgi:hypothetical protein
MYSLSSPHITVANKIYMPTSMDIITNNWHQTNSICTLKNVKHCKQKNSKAKIICVKGMSFSFITNKPIYVKIMQTTDAYSAHEHYLAGCSRTPTSGGMKRVQTSSETWSVGRTVTTCLTLLTTHQWFSTIYCELEYIGTSYVIQLFSFSTTPPLITDRALLLCKLQYHCAGWQLVKRTV